MEKLTIHFPQGVSKLYSNPHNSHRLSFSVDHRVQFLLLFNKASGNECINECKIHIDFGETSINNYANTESNRETYQPSRQRVEINLITTTNWNPLYSTTTKSALVSLPHTPQGLSPIGSNRQCVAGRDPRAPANKIEIN